LVAPVVSVYLGTRYGWRPATLVGAGLAVPVLAGVFLVVRPTEPDRAEQSLRSQLDLSMVVGILGTPSVVYSIFLAAAGTFTFQAVTSFLPTFLVEARELSTATAGVLFGVIFLLSAVAQPITGRISDEVGRDAVTAGTMVIAIVGFLAVLGFLPVVGVVGGVLILGTGLSWFPVVVSRLMDVLPDDDQSRSFGLVRTVYMLFGALGSIVTGTVADTFGWVPAYGVVAGILVVSVVLIATNRVFGSRL
jgi:predicted MFS family arabinose efflux permease